MSKFQSTKIIELGSCAFRQPNATSHCRWLHGYRLQSKIWFGCDTLDENNWVVDFGSLKGLKKKFEYQFDHTTCIADGDPAVYLLSKMQDQDMCNLRIMKDGVGIERFAEWCFDVANNYVASMTNDRCWVEKVEVWEHEKNSATFSKEHTTHSVVTTSELEKELRLDHGEPINSNVDASKSDTSTPTNNTKSTTPVTKKGNTSGSWINKENVAKKNSFLF